MVITKTRREDEITLLLWDDGPCGFDAGDANLRRVVGNDPTNATDPSGEYFVVENKDALKWWKGFFKDYSIVVSEVELPSGRWYLEFGPDQAQAVWSIPDEGTGKDLKRAISTPDVVMMGIVGGVKWIDTGFFTESMADARDRGHIRTYYTTQKDEHFKSGMTRSEQLAQLEHSQRCFEQAAFDTGLALLPGPVCNVDPAPPEGMPVGETERESPVATEEPATPSNPGEPFNPTTAKQGQLIRGIDPNSLKFNRAPNPFKGIVPKVIKVLPDGTVYDGHHYANYCIQRGLPVDVEVVAGYGK